MHVNGISDHNNKCNTQRIIYQHTATTCTTLHASAHCPVCGILYGCIFVVIKKRRRHRVCFSFLSLLASSRIVQVARQRLLAAHIKDVVYVCVCVRRVQKMIISKLTKLDAIDAYREIQSDSRFCSSVFLLLGMVRGHVLVVI